MKKNINIVEQILRVIFGAAIIFLVLTRFPMFVGSGNLVVLFLFLFGAMLLGSGLIGYSPIYDLLNISTTTDEKEEEPRVKGVAKVSVSEVVSSPQGASFSPVAPEPQAEEKHESHKTVKRTHHRAHKKAKAKAEEKKTTKTTRKRTKKAKSTSKKEAKGDEKSEKKEKIKKKRSKRKVKKSKSTAKKE